MAHQLQYSSWGSQRGSAGRLVSTPTAGDVSALRSSLGPEQFSLPLCVPLVGVFLSGPGRKVSCPPRQAGSAERQLPPEWSCV